MTQIKINDTLVSVTSLSTAEILKTYNDMAFELGETPVNRFANRTKAESRLIALADRYNEFLAKRPTAAKEDPAPVNMDTPAPVQLTEADQAQVKAEAQLSLIHI